MNCIAVLPQISNSQFGYLILIVAGLGLLTGALIAWLVSFGEKMFGPTMDELPSKRSNVRGSM